MLPNFNVSTRLKVGMSSDPMSAWRSSSASFSQCSFVSFPAAARARCVTVGALKGPDLEPFLEGEQSILDPFREELLDP